MLNRCHFARVEWRNRYVMTEGIHWTIFIMHRYRHEQDWSDSDTYAGNEYDSQTFLFSTLTTSFLMPAFLLSPRVSRLVHPTPLHWQTPLRALLGFLGLPLEGLYFERRVKCRCDEMVWRQYCTLLLSQNKALRAEVQEIREELAAASIYAQVLEGVKLLEAKIEKLA